ncbi:MAG: GNAT family N-acetyltransferase, partial [Desulfobacterales bacterium]|nr:GNAT family N-acetyltransferase [Desulfobacterales bacterium]
MLRNLNIERPTSNCEWDKMKKENEAVLIDVNEGNVGDTGFFCYMSKRKSRGYRRKLDWLRMRFAEGMQIKMLGQGQRGFIEYIPGEYAWRSVNANGFMMIHCLWVVGKSKGKGYGSFLLNACLKDAKKSGMKGVAAVTSQGNWLIGKNILKKNGFESVGQAPPSFELMVKPFGKGQPPTFTDHWDKKAKQCDKGLTIFRSDQCPYLDDATR